MMSHDAVPRRVLVGVLTAKKEKIISMAQIIVLIISLTTFSYTYIILVSPNVTHTTANVTHHYRSEETPMVELNANTRTLNTRARYKFKQTRA